ncbi:MAG TPA: NAD(+)/NADH kinase [Dehalococcoidia bacterium]|nr:NAD(+)/NADH kinase [Dehalococcoidia bacterium]
MTTYRADATLACLMNRLGILYRPHVERAHHLATYVRHIAEAAGLQTWLCSAWDEAESSHMIAGTDLLVSIGGDGTILHAARVSAPCSVPVLGLNLGKLGFITESEESAVERTIARVLNGEGWTEERTMLSARLGGEEFLALNDAVIRCTAVRLANITLHLNGQSVTTYRADGVIVATATGSTGYSLAAGGPILMPESTDLVIQPISSHLGLDRALVVAGQTEVELALEARDGIVLSLDGQVDRPVHSCETVKVTSSHLKALFLRLQPRTYFYDSIRKKLGGNPT